MLRESINSEDNGNRTTEWYGPFTIKGRYEKGMVSIDDTVSQRITVHESWLKLFEEKSEHKAKEGGK